MAEINELEEGEIEDDGHFLQEVESKARKSKKKSVKSVPPKQKIDSKENQKIDGKQKQKIDSKQSKDYELDDYELLLARHHLIQQQLEKVQAKDVVTDKTEEPITGTKDETKTKKIKGKKKKERANSRKSTESQIVQSNENNVIDLVTDNDDDDLLEMRKALLAHSTKNSPNSTSRKTNNDLASSNTKGKKITDSMVEKTLTVLTTSVNDKTKKIQVSIKELRPSTVIQKQQKVIQKTPLDTVKKRRRRGGKRTKYLAYRAQQKKELAILEQQHAIAYDNYNTVPMDIDNDDSNDVIDGVAPLPLIETPIIAPPPPPPSDGFQPVEDQTGLSMTTTNVAWIPGYMETLEFDNSASSNYVNSQPELKEGKENDSSNSSVEKPEIDEKEMWALRAQALKSLACKRAVKVKMAKQANQTTGNKEVTTVTRKSSLLKDVQVNDLSPLPSPKAASQPISKTIRVSELMAKYTAPVQPPVVIRLGKEDFESSDDEVEAMPFSRMSERAKLQKRRKSATDEELINELKAFTEKAQYKIKSHSLLIQKDQFEYKKLNNEIGEKKILFRKQTEEVKLLQSKLQSALREKASTRKSYTKLHSLITDVKKNLKEKISMRKKIDEEVLRAKGIVSVHKITENGKLSPKVRHHIITITDNFRQNHQDMKIEGESSQDDDVVFDSASSYERDSKNSVLRRTAASVKTMSKEDLFKLELELRKKLDDYKKNQSITDKNKKDSNKNKEISISQLPSVKTQDDLNKIKDSLTKNHFVNYSPDVKINLVDELQKDQNTLHKNIPIVFSKELHQKTIDSFSNNKRSESNLVPSGHYDDEEITQKYRSTLLRFRSYRLSPYFRTQAKYSIKSSTFSNAINPRKTICKFDLLGTCNDQKCAYWHFNDVCQLSAVDVIQDLVAYDPSLFDATETMSFDTKQKLLHSFTQQFVAQYSGKISAEEQLLILWNQMKESRKLHKRPVHECVNFSRREWLKLNKLKSQPTATDDENNYKSQLTESFYYLKDKKKGSKNSVKDASTYESQEIRYYSESYQTVAIMEASLKENPNDTKLWLSLARFHLNDNKGQTATVEKALSVLSKSLEENRDSEDLWIEYLNLFAKNSSADELRELSYQAVMYAATYNVWWTCLRLESAYLGKQEICTEMIKFVIESEDAEEFKSNALLESVLYLCKLLQTRGLTQLAFHCLSAAVGKGKVEDDEEKVTIDDIRLHLTSNDLALLWVCYLSVECFHRLPDHLFTTEECGPGRLVNKKKFLLDWKKPLLVKESDVRSTLQAALESFSDISLSTIKSTMILYENFASYEIALGNIQSARDMFRSLVTKESSFVEGWVLLLLLYMKHSPMDAVVKIAEEAIHKCENDVVLVYFYSNWLYQKGMPRLAVEKLTKCIHTYFQLEPDDPENIVDILHLYRAVLGLTVPYNVALPAYLPKSSQQLKFYYWQCYCLLLKIKEIPPSTTLFSSAIDEAFESAVHQYTSRDNMKKLWKAYIQHKLKELKSQTTVTLKMYHELVELLTRCIVATPATKSVRENRCVTWTDYSFHNQMMELCLHFVPEHQRSKLYHKLIDLMPDNVILASRICEHEMSVGNMKQVRVICEAILQRFPRYIPLWFMAIQVERKSYSIKEARWLHEEAVKMNPDCASLWREYALFEISYTADVSKLDETLKAIIERASNNGVDLKDNLQNLPG